jgi:hypothetical protein
MEVVMSVLHWNMNKLVTTTVIATVNKTSFYAFEARLPLRSSPIDTTAY